MFIEVLFIMENIDKSIEIQILLVILLIGKYWDNAQVVLNSVIYKYTYFLFLSRSNNIETKYMQIRIIKYKNETKGQ